MSSKDNESSSYIVKLGNIKCVVCQDLQGDERQVTLAWSHI